MNNHGVLDQVESTELVPASDPLSGIISIDAERLGGTPCFAGTRVPVKYLFDYLSDGKTLETFLDDFEGVPREEALAALQLAQERLTVDCLTCEDTFGSLRSKAI